MDANSFGVELGKIIDQALAIADESPDVRDEDPFLVQLVALAEEHQEHRAVVEDALISMAKRVGTTPHPNGSVELLAYAVHVLRLPRLITAIEQMQHAAQAAGSIGRPWEWAYRYQRILDAQQAEWADRDLFPSLAT